MKRFFRIFIMAAVMPLLCLDAEAQGWPENYDGVMLQGFFWDSFTDTRWDNLSAQADEISKYFSLVWVPQSGNCETKAGKFNNMGYTPVFWFDHNGSFGTETSLRAMIAAFKAKGTGIIADVVLNHRNNYGENGSWVDYPAETYKGVTYKMLPTDICADDDGGKTKEWADKNNVKLSTNKDTGEDWSGCRDLDHKSENVQKCVDAYLDFLLNDLGYAGFRYDMTKGYAASYTGQYNNKAKPKFSVGEYWDDNAATLKTWINGTKVDGAPQSAAFDFALRYNVRDAANGGDWTSLNKASLAADKDYRRFAVTFVENHDTQYRSASEPLDPIKKDTLAANAYLLAMPGTPCVFLPHWKAYKQEIKSMIEVRRAAGINNQSTFSNFNNNKTYQVYNVKGEKADLLVCVGTGAAAYGGNNRYTEILSGYHYRYFLANKAGIAWADKASGEYKNEVEVVLTAVSEDESAQVVYTLDGSAPTAGSAKVASGTSVRITESCTLTVGILQGGAVSGISKREYSIKEVAPFVPHTATVFFKDPQWSTPVYFYVWDSNDNSQLNGNWPGKEISEKRTVGGEEWYCQTFDIKKEEYFFNIIFNQGMGKAQTVDIGPITEDTYFELAAMDGGKFTVNDVTEKYTSGIEDLELRQPGGRSHRAVSLQGVPVSDSYKGIVILNGRKYLRK